MKPLTKSQAVCLMVMTGVVVMDPKVFRQEIDKKLERTVSSAEYTDPDFIDKLRGMYYEDFMKLVQITEDSGLVLPSSC